MYIYICIYIYIRHIYVCMYMCMYMCMQNVITTPRDRSTKFAFQCEP